LIKKWDGAAQNSGLRSNRANHRNDYLVVNLPFYYSPF
jgi:hypothetical protein